MSYSLLWAIPLRLDSICLLPAYTAYEDGIDTVFRNVGT